MNVSNTYPSPRLIHFMSTGRPKRCTEHNGYNSLLASGLRFIIQNPLLCRLLTSAQSLHTLLHEALPSTDDRKAGQISPGKSMILPCTPRALPPGAHCRIYHPPFSPDGFRDVAPQGINAPSPRGSALGVSVRQLTGFCTPASFRRSVALTPLPSASTF